MRKILAVMLLLAVALTAAGLYGLRVWRLESLEIAPPAIENLNFKKVRDVYPYSVVPGGTYDSREAAESAHKDEVVRSHYEGIDIERLHPVRLSAPLFAYVSYRKGDAVNWTDHPVQIAANELVLTDGVKMVRARCGNRIEIMKPEPLPATVVRDDPPPPDIVFETPLPGPPMISTPNLPKLQVAEQRIPIQPPPNWKPPIVPCCDYTPTSEVPEPGTLILVGLGAFALAKKLRSKY